jgi:hypothetical protein
MSRRFGGGPWAMRSRLHNHHCIHIILHHDRFSMAGSRSVYNPVMRAGIQAQICNLCSSMFKSILRMDANNKSLSLEKASQQVIEPSRRRLTAQQRYTRPSITELRVSLDLFSSPRKLTDSQRSLSSSQLIRINGSWPSFGILVLPLMYRVVCECQDQW